MLLCIYRYKYKQYLFQHGTVLFWRFFLYRTVLHFGSFLNHLDIFQFQFPIPIWKLLIPFCKKNALTLTIFLLKTFGFFICIGTIYILKSNFSRSIVQWLKFWNKNAGLGISNLYSLSKRIHSLWLLIFKTFFAEKWYMNIQFILRMVD